MSDSIYSNGTAPLHGLGKAIGVGVIPAVQDSLQHQNDQLMKQHAVLGAVSASRYKRVLITIEETSNGHIIKIGNVIRVCGTEQDLMAEVAAAFTQYKLEG